MEAAEIAKTKIKTKEKTLGKYKKKKVKKKKRRTKTGIWYDGYDGFAAADGRTNRRR